MSTRDVTEMRLAGSIDSYIEETSNPESTAAVLIEKLDSWDSTRR